MHNDIHHDPTGARAATDPTNPRAQTAGVVDTLNLDTLNLDELRAAFVNTCTSVAWPSQTVMDPARTVARAELELWRVHHAEVARVLARAARMLAHSARSSRVTAFQRRAVGLLEAARAAGARVPALADRVVQTEPRVWPTALQLARAAWDLEPSLENEGLVALLQEPRGQEPHFQELCRKRPGREA